MKHRPPQAPPPAPAPNDPAADPHLVPSVILARFLARYGVLNTALEDYAAGPFPRSRAGDFSDVFVQAPEGAIPWREAARLSEEELEALLREVEVQLSRCMQVILRHQEAGKFDALLARLEAELFGPEGVRWDRLA